MQDSWTETEKLTAIGTMAAGIAHELLNPLMGILNFTQYCLEKTAADDPRFSVLQDIERETKRCAGIVQNLTTFSRIEKRTEEEYHKQSLPEIIERLVQLLSYRIEKEGVRFTWHVAEDIPEVWIRVDGIHQVLLNLVTNALDAVAVSAKKEISIEGYRRGKFIEVTITDSGKGISPANLSRIFDPFFTTKPVGQGTGMGLTVSRNIILEHGGDITCRSEPGGGPVFEIRLPLAAKGGPG
ncbi:MAG: HAMP domain-containing sensor histidine kinase [Dehalococcoidia bacterium]|nr:HAMP domain-containing sensor histidine kinase [Dehalococcoidia bacterium]